MIHDDEMDLSFEVTKERPKKYGLKCSYYKKQFNSIQELVDDIILSGMDPNYMITYGGKSIGEKATAYIVE